VASEAFTYAGGGFETFRTARLTNVTEVRWDQAANALPQFDNITVVFNTNEPAAQPVLRVRHAGTVKLDIAGLMVNALYALESSDELAHWTLERTFRSSSTVNFPGFIAPAVSSNRFYRVRGL
jgi:hypothetical protein